MGSTLAASPTLQCQATRGNRCSTSSGGGDTSDDDARLARLHQLLSQHSRGRPARRKRKRWSVSCWEASALEKACRCHLVGGTQARLPQTLWLLRTSLRKTLCDFNASYSTAWSQNLPFLCNSLCTGVGSCQNGFPKPFLVAYGTFAGLLMQMLAPFICLEGP